MRFSHDWLIVARRWGCLAVLLCWCMAGWAAPHAYVLLTERLGWADLIGTPLPATAALAGMSDPAMPRGSEAMLVTLSAGGRNISVPHAALQQAVLDIDEHGRHRIPESLWTALCEANKAAHAGSAPGTLGATLRQHDVRTVLVSAPHDQVRGALVAADTEGVIDAWHPWHGVSALPAPDDAVVFLLLPARESIATLVTLAEEFPATPVLFASLTPGEIAEGTPRRGEITPVMLLGHGPGLLTSRSTHWTGVVSANDFAPTLYALAGVRMAEPTGFRLGITRHAHPATAMHALAAQTRAVYLARRVLSITWGALLLASCMLIGITGCRRYRCVHLSWLFAGWVIPAILVMGLPALWQLPLWLLLLIMLAFWGLVAWSFSHLSWLAAWATGATISGSVLALTTITNSLIDRQPFLGMAISAGHRFYGVGNEGMGVMLVLLTAMVGVAIARYPSAAMALIILVFGTASVLLGSSWWGANWGGAMAALLTGALYLLVHYRTQVRWWHLLLLPAIVLVCGTLLMIALTVYYPQMTSHTGALGQEISHKGWSILFTVVARKISFAWAVWQMHHGWLLVIGGTGIGALLYRLERQACDKPRYIAALRETLWVVWGSAILAGLINDNGITLTALMWLTMTPAVVALLLEHRAHTRITVSAAPMPVP